jgi:3-oxoacyl-[acyl-carrier protein] reductase
LAFTKALAREVASSGIRVNCVAPGPIKTDITDVLKEEVKQAIKQSLPMGRFGLPEEVASAVLFLSTSDSAIFVGQTLGPNCGGVML